MVNIIAKDGKLKVEGTFSFGDMGTYIDKQIGIDASIREIKKNWEPVIKAKKHKRCTDDDVAAFLTWFINGIEKNINNDIESTNNWFHMCTYLNMKEKHTEFWKYDKLTVREALPVDKEAIYELNHEAIMHCDKEYTAHPDGTTEAPKVFLRRLFPAFNWDNYIKSIVPGYILFNYGRLGFSIEIMCYDRYRCHTLYGICTDLDKELDIQEWRDAYWPQADFQITA